MTTIAIKNANGTVEYVEAEGSGTEALPYRPVQAVQFADSASTDAFSRLRVSNPVSLFDSQQQYDKGRLYWEESLAGSASATHNADESSIDLTVTANAADVSIRQTREYFRYQPGKSQLVFMTGVMGSATSGVTKRWGYFDESNGFYIEQDATGDNNIVKRSKITGSVVNTGVASASWNIDPMDGTGPSGITIDFSKSQIMVLDLQWLAVGRVQIGFDIDGVIYYAHQFNHANAITATYSTTANLPCRYEIRTDGTNGDTLKTICSSVNSEGGFEEGRGSIFSASNGATLISVTTRRPILSIRPKDTFNSIENRGLIMPDGISMFTQDKQCFFEIVYGGTLTGASFSSVNDDSIVESDVAATAISGGIVVKSIATDKKSEVVSDGRNRFPMTLDISGAHPTSPYADCYTIVATSIETATDCSASMSWSEFR